MPNINRILAHCVGGGPLDDQWFSVHEEQDIIVGMNSMPENSKYVKRESTLRELTNTEISMHKYMFPEDFGHVTMCEFDYEPDQA